mmetsp:Transcript_2073/g.4878  ORF Transcript_2073/g.4878 Transcript_2073/m.4878 type:complete len:206 (-) Transcript_2073:446-1063(-)
MQVVPDSIDEELHQIVRRLYEVRDLLYSQGAQFGRHDCQFVLGYEVGDLPSGEDAVYDLHKALVLDFRLCEEEGDLLALLPARLVEQSDVVQEGVHVVRLRDGDLEAAVAGRMGGQPGERLLAGPPHAHQQDASFVHPEGSGDAHEVLEGVVEQYNVHLPRHVGLVVPNREVAHPLPNGVQRGAHFVALRCLRDQGAVLVVLLVP